MKTIENLGLQTISKIIVESISTSSIYCFGEKKQIETIANPFQEFVSTHKEHTHFYLMVLTDEYVSDATADISDIIKTKTDGSYTVKLLLYKAKSGQYLTPNQLYSFHYHFFMTRQTYLLGKKRLFKYYFLQTTCRNLYYTIIVSYFYL